MTGTPQISVVYDRRKKASPERKAPVEIRICYNYMQRFINTGIKLYPRQWKKGRIVNTKDSMSMNMLLENLLTVVRDIILEMLRAGDLDITVIHEKLHEKMTGTTSFISFCEQRALVRKYGKSADSQKRYDRFIRLFKGYGKIVHFDDISDQSVVAYDNYLTSLGMKPYSKWNNYHRFLNSFIIDAIDAGYIDRNPYKWLNINKEKSNTGIGKYLSFEEWKKIKGAVFSLGSLERVRDLFIFQTYTCLSYSDLACFDCNNITTINGMKVYTGKRHKTGVHFTIPLLPGAIDILNKYNYKLPVISNVKYNEYLKAVAIHAGIDKPVSSHWARHTGATLLLNSGIDIGIVSKICGHSSTKITEQVYAKLLDDTVVNAISKNTVLF